MRLVKLSVEVALPVPVLDRLPVCGLFEILNFFERHASGWKISVLRHFFEYYLGLCKMSKRNLRAIYQNVS